MQRKAQQSSLNRVHSTRFGQRGSVNESQRIHVRSQENFMEDLIKMKQLFMASGLAIVLAAASHLSAQTAQDTRNNHTWNHGEVGVYGDLFRVGSTGKSPYNYLGLGARAGFNVTPHAAIEAEMNYDFEKNYSTTNTSGGTTTTVTSSVRPITGLFGPKFQLGSSGPFRAFLEAKGGFIDFTTSCNAAAGSTACFTGSLSGFGGPSTHFAGFPGGGFEFFAGPLGLRVEGGDELWLNNGLSNNLRVTFSPTLRF
jgi:hypothetical protein